MEDKRIRQLTLPLELSKHPEFKEFVKQSWNITFARQKKMSVYAKRIMAMVLAQIKDDHLKLQDFYRIHVSHIVTESGIDGKVAYREVKKAINELTKVYWLIEEPEQYLVPRHLLDTTKRKRIHGYESGYDHGWITVVLNPALDEYFLQLAHYTIYELKHYMHFKSWYSMRMFELLSAFRDSGWWRVSIEEFRELMDCKDKYPETKNLIDRTLNEPLEELKETKLAFNCEPIYDESKIGKGRKPIIALQFVLSQVEPTTLDHLRGYSPAYDAILNNLQKFKVTDQNIIRYIKAIGAKRTQQLIQEWQLKELSKNRIDDKLKYCNKIWVAEGKKALKEKIGITI